MGMKQTNIWLDEVDRANIVAIQRLYGCESFSHAVRLAARIALQAGRPNVPLPPTSRFSRTKRELKDLHGIARGAFRDDFDIDAFGRELSRAWERDLAEPICDDPERHG